jgi:hypothetical protein
MSSKCRERSCPLRMLLSFNHEGKIQIHSDEQKWGKQHTIKDSKGNVAGRRIRGKQSRPES